MTWWWGWGEVEILGGGAWRGGSVLVLPPLFHAGALKSSSLSNHPLLFIAFYLVNTT